MRNYQKKDQKKIVASVGKTMSARTLGVDRKIANRKEENRRKINAHITHTSVHAFCYNEANSVCLLWKKDVMIVNGTKVQKYILNDILDILHKKYNYEHPN